MEWRSIHITIFTLIIIIIITFITIIIKKKFKSFIPKKQKNNEMDPKHCLYRKIRLFSPAERSFFGILQQVLENKVVILGKIRVADILIPKNNKDHSRWQKAFNRISKKHFDFVLCSKDTLSVLCVIELNDKSHLTDKQKLRDEFIINACKSAELPLIQIPNKSSYIVQEIKKLLNPFINLL